MNITAPPELTPIVAVLRTSISLIKFPCFVLQLPISLLNSFSILRTSLLHPNLKFVLLTQSASFCLFAAAHSMQIICPIRPDFNVHSSILINAISVFAVLFGSFVGHALLAERTIATFWANNYEHRTAPWFSIAWFIPISLFCAFNSYQQAERLQRIDNSVTFGLLTSYIIVLGLSLAEVVASTILGTHNLKLYRMSIQRHSNKHNLSERYQLAENIRTLRQLVPTFVLHFSCALLSIIVPFLLFYQIVVDILWTDTIVMLFFMYLSINNVLIEISILSRHPILHQNAVHLLKLIWHQVFCTENRVRDSCGDVKGAQNTIIGIDGQKVVLAKNAQNETERYFEQLQREWN